MSNPQTGDQSQLDPEVQQALNPDPQGVQPGGDWVRDPVCGQLVDKRTAQDTIAAPVTGDGQTLYFHSANCKALFEEDPTRYGYTTF